MKPMPNRNDNQEKVRGNLAAPRSEVDCSNVMDGGALTAADLRLEDHSRGHNDDDDDHTEYTDDSFLESSSLRKMMKNSIQMLDSLTDEVRELTQDRKTSKDSQRKVITVAADDDAPKPLMVVTPASTCSLDRNDRGLEDMTIDISHDSTNYSIHESKCSTISATFSPLLSPIHAAVIIKDVQGAAKMPSLNDLPEKDNGSSNQNHDEAEDDEFSLDWSLANEMNALKEVALELEQELQSADVHAVQKTIERAANSQDPKVKGVLEMEDKKIIRKILYEELQKNEPQNIVLRYLYKAAMNTLTHDETTHLLVAVVVVIWAIIFSMIYSVLTFNLV